MRGVAVVVAASAVAGCASFEDPSIVLDLRVIAMTMLPAPERVIDIDLQADTPPTIDDVIAQLESQPKPRVCALVADPATTRDLRYSMNVCIPEEGRCNPDKPKITIADGETIYDPEVWLGIAEPPCAEVPVDGNFVGMLFESLKASPGSALVGVDYAVELRVGRVDEHPELDVFALKQGRVSARVPDDRQPNQNPAMVELQISPDVGDVFTGGPRPCAQPFGALAQITSGETATLYPVETENSRETFTVPTLDGEFIEFTEYNSYQWLGSRGSFTDEITGGPPDLLGNETLLGTDWKAPVVASPTDVPIWVVQRDDRYGVTWFETCVRVNP